MRILHVAEAFGGGLLDVVCTIAEGTARAGDDVAIAFGRRPETPAQLHETISPAIELFPLEWGRRRPLEEAGAARELWRLIRGWEPDVVHLHSSVAGVVGAVVTPPGVAVVYSPHSFESALPGSRARRGLVRSLERFTVRRATVVGAVSPSEAQMSERLGARSVTVVENGIAELDPGRALARDLPRQPSVIGGGRTVPQRRPDACARILAGLRDVADVAWVGGGGGGRGVAGQAALDAASIPTTGWVERREFLRRLEATTVYLHWTAWDGQPLSVLEALACDAVVIASDIAPNRHVLGEAQVFSSEAEALAAARRTVIESDFAEALRQAQRARRGRWSAVRMVAAWGELYQRTVSGS